jgi:hypothetical protein
MATTAEVGDLIRPTDGGPYRGVVTSVSTDVVRHRCLRTGEENQKSLAGFFCRYSTVGAYDERREERAASMSDKP